MALETVTVTWNEQDIGQGALAGYVDFQLNAIQADSTDGIDIHPEPSKPYFFIDGTGSSDPLVANDSANLPAGSYYTVTVAIQGQAPYVFRAFVNYANGAEQTLAFLIAGQAQPVAQYAQYLPLGGGTMTGPIVLPSMPSTAQQAAPKGYVDAFWTGVYDVRWPYGATGNGTTDDTEAIQAAVAAAVAAGGGLVWIPPHMTCLVSELIALAGGVELAGSGRFTSSILANASAPQSNWAASPGGWPAVVGAVNATGCGVRDLGVNANGTSTSGICMLGGTSVYIRDCYVQNATGHSGTHFFGTQAAGVNPVLHGIMTGNITDGCLYNSVFDGECVNCAMTGNVSYNPLASHFSLDGGSGLAATNGQGNTVSGNSGYGGTNGSSGNGVYLRDETDVTVAGNTVTGFEGANLVYVTNSSASITGNRFSGNASAPPTYGLHLNIGAGVSEIAGNVFENAATGIYTTSGTTPFYGRVRDNDFVNVTTLHSGNPIPAGMEFSGNRQLSSSLAVVSPFNLLLESPALPLASGTVYQNTSGMTIVVEQPVYATAPGTSGSIAVAMSAASTPAAQYTRYVAGGTTSGAPEVVVLTVPPWSYYSFTASGVTLANAAFYPQP
jgi:hypothetical protein